MCRISSREGRLGLVPMGDIEPNGTAPWRAMRFLRQRTMAVSMTMDESDKPQAEVRITSRLIDALYTEAMLLADEARSYFDDAGRDERATLEPFARVGFACESLKVTTRIMHIV